MTKALAARLDLDQAWRRAKWDAVNRNFVDHSREIEVIQHSLSDWLDGLREQIASANYSPKPCEVFDYPKPGFQVRPAARLELQDYVVYSALGQEVIKTIYASLRGLSKDRSYRLRKDRDTIPWFYRPVSGWRQFARDSLRRIEKGAQFVLFTDIAGFYENIDLERLKYSLLGAGVDNDILSLLMKCLRKWSGTRMRGIPQGCSVSDLLAKHYMEPVDRLLQREGLEHLRYVDDIRIFCGGHIEARKAIRTLSSLTRERGLNLQAAKTAIHPAEEAKKKIEGVVPQILALEQELVSEARKEFGWASQYLYPADLRKLHAELQEGATREAVETAFREEFLEKGAFDPSLFHYLLKRLGPIGSPVAVDYCILQLEARPEETDYVLEYISDLGADDATVATLIKYLGSPEAIYEFQCFQILRWLFHLDPVPCTDKVLDVARGLMKERQQPLWLRSYAIGLVGRLGDGADLESIEELYLSSGSELEGAVVLCALERMHKARRNAAFARAGGDGFLQASAIRWVQAQT